MKTSLVFALPFAAALGCASVSPKADFDDVVTLVHQRGGGQLHWDSGTPADARVQAHVRDLLSRGALTPETAVEIALLRNQGLIATYEELGIAQADLVQAGLLRNPSFGARVRFPSGGGVIDSEFSVAQDFLDLFTLPLRKRIAAARLDGVKARVASAVLQLTADVRAAIVTVQAAQALAEVQKLVLDAQSAAAELRRGQREAGDVGELELTQEEAFFQQGKLEVARAQARTLEVRERANRLLGLWGGDAASWTVESTMADLPDADPPLDDVESLAIARRLDLAAARSDAQTLEQAARLAGLTRYLPGLQFGVSTERDAEGTRVTGPELSVELPLFDQGQARTARLLAQVRQSRARQAALEVDVRAEARTLRNRLAAARGVAEQFQTVLLPLRERIVAESQRRYDSGLLGIYQLLAVRRDELDGYRDYLESVRDYWVARADLERAAGGSLTPQSALPGSAQPQSTQPQSAGEKP